MFNLAPVDRGVTATVKQNYVDYKEKLKYFFY